MKQFLLFFAMFLIHFSDVSGQATELYELKTDSITINTSKTYSIQSIQLIGNKKTKDFIILREISVNIGDTINGNDLTKELEQARKNILNTGLFHFATVNLVEEGNQISIYVMVNERWYFFPFPIFEVDDTNFNTWFESMDWNRLNYGIFLTQRNIRGRDETLKLTFQLGFRERLKLSYNIPYINRKKTLGLGISTSFLRRHEIAYITNNNKRLQVRQEDEYLYKNQTIGFSLNYRKKIFNKHSLSISYNNVLVSDSVIDLNPEYLSKGKVRNEFITVTYNFTRDKRDSKNYPLKGHYLSATVQKLGLELFDNSMNFVNTTFQAKKFSKLSDRFSLAGSASTTFSFNKTTPYFLENGLGYGSGVRGYEYYVIDGQNIGIAKAQFRFSLLQPKVYRMGFLPSEKFSKMHFAIYSSIFADIGYVDDQIGYPLNNLANTWIYGTGVSLDFVTYYDLVLRTEFSFNKMGESGLFIHFVAPI